MNICSRERCLGPTGMLVTQRVNHSPTSQPHPLILPELNLRVVHCVLGISVDLVIQIWLCLFSVLPSSGELIYCCSAQRHLGPEVYPSLPYVTKTTMWQV